MIQIKDDCTANAIKMLRKSATKLGKVGGWEFFVLDGDAWAVDGGVVCRSEESIETEIIIRLCKEIARLSPASKEVSVSELVPCNVVKDSPVVQTVCGCANCTANRERLERYARQM